MATRSARTATPSGWQRWRVGIATLLLASAVQLFARAEGGADRPDLETATETAAVSRENPSGPASAAQAIAASPTPNTAPSPDSQATEAAHRREARRHFDNGVKLYRDHNYGGALVEFGAAHQLSPSAGALQNVALCQKGLFRYAEAADTLTELLARYGRTLSADTERAVRDTVEELNGLVGSVVVVGAPPGATIAVDGRAVEASELARGIRLNVGEHTVAARALGYDSVTRVIRVAGGDQRVPVTLELRATMGFLRVYARDSEAAIAVDGQPLAYQYWRGPLPPGLHLLQVYRPGFATLERSLEIEVGKTVELEIELEPATGEDEQAPHVELVTSMAAPIKPRQQRGWYTLGTLSLLGPPDAPSGLSHQSNAASAHAPGLGLGVRAGYRLWTPVSLELMLDWGRWTVSNACDTTVTNAGRTCGTSNPVERQYSLATVRVGPNLRLSTSGEKLRLSSTLGAGSVRHTLEITEPPPDAASSLPAIRATGWNPYLMLEIGAQLNWGSLLLGLDAFAFVDGTDATRTRDQNTKSYQPYDGLLIVGLGLRGGYSEWAPTRGSKLLSATPPSSP